MTAIRPFGQDLLSSSFIKNTEDNGHETHEHYNRFRDSITENYSPWLGHYHDMIEGNVNALMLSFDDSFILSAGSDGGLFIFRNNNEAIKEGRIS